MHRKKLLVLFQWPRSPLIILIISFSFLSSVSKVLFKFRNILVVQVFTIPNFYILFQMEDMFKKTTDWSYNDMNSIEILVWFCIFPSFTLLDSKNDWLVFSSLDAYKFISFMYVTDDHFCNSSLKRIRLGHDEIES